MGEVAFFDRKAIFIFQKRSITNWGDKAHCQESMWRPSQSIRRPRKKLFRRFLMPSTPCYWKNNRTNRYELFFNDLKQRELRLLPTTIGVSFWPDAVTKKAQVALFRVFATTTASSALMDQRALKNWPISFMFHIFLCSYPLISSLDRVS